MKEIKNKSGKRICDISKDGKTVVIQKKGIKTTIRAENGSRLIVKNS